MNFDYHLPPITSTDKTLLIIDQNLKGFEGHHYTYTHAIIVAAQKAGIAVKLATHADFAAAELGGAPVVGRFARHGGHSAKSFIIQTARSALQSMPGRLRQSVLSMVPKNRHGTMKPSYPDQNFVAAFLKILAASQLNESDHVLIHTVTESEFLGLVAGLAANPQMKPNIHIVLRYDGTEAVRAAFQNIENTGASVSFWTDTELLAAHYRAWGCKVIHVLPIPHGLHLVNKPSRAENAPLTLSYLGGARGDKGFHRIPALIAELTTNPTMKNRLHFQIQTTFGISREEPLMAKTKQALRGFPHNLVTLLETPPDEEEFEKALLATDILLLPYDRAAYERRSSGLLIQALAAGIPAVIPSHTWLSSVAPPGACAIYERDTDLSATVMNAVETIDHLAVHAKKSAPRFALHNTAETLVSLLMAQSSHQS